jgi:hypothetical protein
MLLSCALSDSPAVWGAPLPEKAQLEDSLALGDAAEGEEEASWAAAAADALNSD